VTHNTASLSPVPPPSQFAFISNRVSGNKRSNVPSGRPPPGSDMELNISFFYISLRNAERIPRAVSKPKVARLEERGRRPTYRAYRKTQHVDTPVHNFAISVSYLVLWLMKTSRCLNQLDSAGWTLAPNRDPCQ